MRKIILYITASPLLIMLSVGFAEGEPSRELSLAEIAKNSEAHVRALAETIGERHYLKISALDDAALYLEAEFGKLGYSTTRQNFGTGRFSFRNVVAVLPGQESPSEIIVIGAHYDSVSLSPGADDNASGVSALLELARLLKAVSLPRTIHFIGFANEEQPFSNTEKMGSRVAANRAKAAGEKIIAMISLESIGFYSEKPDTQRYPPLFKLFYPDSGNFIGFVGNWNSRSLARISVNAFRVNSAFPAERVSVPEALAPAIRRSDHSAYWDHGYPAIMVTDTAEMRNPNYHTPHDQTETLNFTKLAEVILGLKSVIEVLAREF
jgi:Zn-dependent M28 family amino/carboxypeptidase